MLQMLGQSGMRRKAAERLHAAIVARAREPAFFTKFGVPDTIDGRFDLVVLHVWLVLERLRDEGFGELAQRLMDTVFIGFDEGLRDLGAGDMGMGRRIKTLADAFYGRLTAYERSGGKAAMTEAILRNVYRGQGASAHRAAVLAEYVESARLYLSRQTLADGVPEFGPLPGGDAET